MKKYSVLLTVIRLFVDPVRAWAPAGNCSGLSGLVNNNVVLRINRKARVPRFVVLVPVYSAYNSLVAGTARVNASCDIVQVNCPVLERGEEEY